MGVLRLGSYDSGDVDLPDVCMKCGAPAAVRKSKNFSWFPPWIWVLLIVCGLLPFAIVALIMTKRRRVEVPLCEEHKNHWIWRQIVVIGGFFALFGVGFVAWVAMLDDRGRPNDNLFGLLCIGWVVGLIAWLILAVILQSTSVRATEITDTSITLGGVSDAFIAEYKNQWRPSPERLDDLAREHWNQGKRRPRDVDRSYDDEEDRFRRPGKDDERCSPPDAYQEDEP
jgi:hypothetical protein